MTSKTHSRDNALAFRLHVVTRGISLPNAIDDNVRVLLRGLLARDPLRRWGAAEVRRWLDGEIVPAPEEVAFSAHSSGPSISLGTHAFTRSDFFALAAAEKGNWNEARELMLRGSVATWLAARDEDQRMQAEVRRLTGDESLPEDQRHALALLAMNPALPLTVAGEIVTPAWLLANPNAGYAIVTGETARHLERMGREPWLVRLATRASAVGERAKLLEIELDEKRLRVDREVWSFLMAPPPTRGCTRRCDVHVLVRKGSPAHAGMHPSAVPVL